MIKTKTEGAKTCWLTLVWACLLAVGVNLQAEDKNLLSKNPSDADFVLSSENGTAPLCVEATTDPAVARAASDLAADVERVADRKPVVIHDLATLSGDAVIVGVLGHSPLLDVLVATGKLDATGLKGSWESYVVQVVDSPLPNIRRALVIAGSDRRGAIYGLYEISAMIGVSPWYWWADVTPPKKSKLTIAGGTRRFGPPSVKYRGIFINDEDWGLQPWAAKTFEPESGNIGPKTYAKVFELLLRLKANTLWPGMHPGTRPFNASPENAILADQYAIVMGSSHAEPMLRNNVGEWTAPPTDYNYLTNREGVHRYWEERVATNSRFENIYTLGMRGIHDSNMQGPKTDAERIDLLEKIFVDQRALIAKYADSQVGRVIPNAPSAESPDAKTRRIKDNPPYPPSEVERVPQMFCAYKEVLDLYRQGLRVPDDVTIVWPDDNFGYVRNAATPAERKRAGGFGVYYHASYLGRPLSYLWLCTTPPALIWEEMHRAYEHGADRIWIVNVGDLKPAEIASEFFLQLAWDINRWHPETLNDFFPEWAAREFGPTHAVEIGALMTDYYTLNFQRKPEHLQWWLPRETARASDFTDAEVQTRLDAFAQLRIRADLLRSQIQPSLRDAFFELVYYPVTGSALANIRYFEGERGHSEIARGADTQLVEQTRFFNEEVAGGKWRHLMTLEPADKQWASMRIAPWTLPAAARAPVPSPAGDSRVTVDAAHFTASTARPGAAWTIIPGLGRTGKAVTVLPSMLNSIDLAHVTELAPRLDYALTFPTAGTFTVQIHLLPTHPLSGSALRVAVAIDDGTPQLVSLEVDDGGPGWAQGVLAGVRIATLPLTVPSAGPHTLHVYGIESGVVLDKIILDPGHR